ncbi:MAG: Protein of unknown function precursor containing a C-terminal secretion signal [Bacteroidetes bacterium]|nr:Protein of unknown function precursor containing a C-terminal secretion signal [Bacteroidota bacterium]
MKKIYTNIKLNLMKSNLLFLFTFYSIMSFSQTNLATNGNLESWINPTTLNNWTIENNVSQNTTDVAEGTSSALFSISNNTLKPLILAKVPLTNGRNYTVSFKFKYVNANFNGMHPMCLQIIRQGSATTTTHCYFASNNNWVNKSISFTPDQTGDYDLSFSTATYDGEPFNVLIDDIKVFDPLSSSVNEIDGKESFNIYPTITEGNIYFDPLGQYDNFKLSVYDTYGRKQNVIFENNSIDLSELAAGMYFVNLKMNSKSITKRVIKK